MTERSDMPARTNESYRIEYSGNHSLPTVVVPRGPDNIPEEGWFVTGEHGGENGEYYATFRDELIMTDNGPMRATKDIRKDTLEALNPGLVERLGRATPEQVGSIALAASNIEMPLQAQDAPSVPETAMPEANSEIDSVISKLDALNQGLSESDKTALWKFSTALYSHEEESALRAMSEELRTNAALRYQVQDLQRNLSNLRQTK